MKRNDKLTELFLPEFINTEAADTIKCLSKSDLICTDKSHSNCKLCIASGFEDIKRNEFLLHVHEQVFNSGKYNFEGCRIRINDKLNFEFLRHMLMNYCDKDVCDLLEFGFPLGCIEETSASVKIPKNHKRCSAISFGVRKLF